MTNRRHHTPLLHACDVQLYQVCEDATEVLIYGMVVFSPWAFGTTQPWSIWIMNGAGYVLGALLLIKITIRRWKGYCAPRWTEPNSNLPPLGRSKVRSLSAMLTVLTLAILGYVLLSGVNAAATYQPGTLNFIYHSHLNWLPHSLNSSQTWAAFWNYLGLAGSFWAIADWLLGKSAGEERTTRQKALIEGTQCRTLPARLGRLLWLLSANGALLGLESILQRLEGSGRLLFIIKPVINPEATSQFGPYHYRANAAAYFNLVWPLCLGFWWMLQRSRAFNQRSHFLLLPCGVIMAACPIISTSRGGALVTISIIAVAILSMVTTHLSPHQHEDKRARRVTLAFLTFFFAGALSLGFALGWKNLKPRMKDIQHGFAAREELFEAARPMAADYPWFGTGPGTFESIFQLYRNSIDAFWPGQLHNDWLETRITFGWAGSALIGLAFVTVLLRWFVPSGLAGDRRFMILLWLAFAGALLHARFDFPFQIYSILFLFLVLCAVAFTLSQKS